MSEDLKPCPKCKFQQIGVNWSAHSTDDAYVYHVGCLSCGYTMKGSTVRVLTAASKDAAWRRTKAKWNKLERAEVQA